MSLLPGQVATTRLDCVDPDCLKYVPVRVERHYDHEQKKYHTIRLTELQWPRTSLMAAASADLPRPGGQPWGSVKWPCPPPTRSRLIAKGFVRPAGSEVPFLPLDEKAIASHEQEHAAYLQAPEQWQRTRPEAAAEYEADLAAERARILQPESRTE